MKLSVISFTDKGNIINNKIKESLKDCEVYSCIKKDENFSLSSWTDNAFAESDGIIFIGAAGIAVRAISPYVSDKTKDPAVVVCDELGKYVIPILSGHIGGANELAVKIGEILGAVPVITTATDINNVWAADSWAVKKGFKIANTENIKYISSALLKGEKIGIISDIDIDEKEFPPNAILGKTDGEYGIVISPYIKNAYTYTLNLIPKCIYAGVGSKKNSDRNALKSLLYTVLKENNIHIYSIKGVATIDIKANEDSVIELCNTLKTELKCYTAEELNKAEGSFSASDFVKKITGTDNVCERSAVLCSAGGIIVPKTSLNGVTLALAGDKSLKNLKVR